MFPFLVLGACRVPVKSSSKIGAELRRFQLQGSNQVETKPGPQVKSRGLFGVHWRLDVLCVLVVAISHAM